MVEQMEKKPKIEIDEELLSNNLKQSKICAKLQYEALVNKYTFMSSHIEDKDVDWDNLEKSEEEIEMKTVEKVDEENIEVYEALLNTLPDILGAEARARILDRRCHVAILEYYTKCIEELKKHFTSEHIINYIDNYSKEIREKSPLTSSDRSELRYYLRKRMQNENESDFEEWKEKLRIEWDRLCGKYDEIYVVMYAERYMRKYKAYVSK